MAYRLKKVSYQDRTCHILLQNENGPCPLIAAANALLLRGALALEPSTVRTNVISIDDLVHILADFALHRTSATSSATHSVGSIGDEAKGDDADGDRKVSTMGGDVGGEEKAGEGAAVRNDGTGGPDPTNKQQHQHQLDEMMTLLPGLQFGLDVNPKFTQGPDGCEYTVGLTTFDVLGVDLVHGWLADPQNALLREALQNKSYNELVELVIHGNEANGELERLSEELDEKERLLERSMLKGWVDVNVSPDDGEEKVPSDGGDASDAVDAGDRAERDGSSGMSHPLDFESVPANEAAAPADAAAAPPAADAERRGRSSSVPVEDLEREVKDLKLKLAAAQSKATRGHLINSFLNDTGHQLTYYGLERLHAYISEGRLCVFFRNNHFSTIVKHEDRLYLLVTDLGYANVEDVVWERLDVIDGDTDYVDCCFRTTKPQSLMAPSAPVLNPEQVLSQKGQLDLDHELAKRLQDGKNITDTTLDDEEAALIAAATEESLNTYHTSNHGGVVGGGGGGGNGGGGGTGTVVALPGGGDGRTPSAAATQAAGGASPTIEDSDHALAMAMQAQLQSEEASESLARRLHEEELRRARVAPAPSRGNTSSRRTGAQAASGGDKSSCVVS